MAACSAGQGGAGASRGNSDSSDSGRDAGKPNPPTTPTTPAVRVRIVAQSDDGVAYLLAEAPETRIQPCASPATAQADRTPIRHWVFAWDERVAALVPPFMAYRRQALLSQVCFLFRFLSFRVVFGSSGFLLALLLSALLRSAWLVSAPPISPESTVN